MTNDEQPYDIATLRKLLIAAFTAEELRRFCLDRPIFRPIHDEFGPGLGLHDMVDRVIAYCRTRLLWDELLTEVKEERPRQYARFVDLELDRHKPVPLAQPPSRKPAPVSATRIPRSWRVWALVGMMPLVVVVGLAVRQMLLPEPTSTPTPAMTVAAATASPTATDTITSRPTSTNVGPPCVARGTTWTRSGGAVMVCVPAGEFLMGSGPDTVYLDAFWIDQTEVTNAQYQECERARACGQRLCSHDDNLCAGVKCDNLNAPDQPVVCVNWDDAQAYAAWVGGRLPTDAEWEKACRGTDGREYPWGNHFDCRYGNFGDPDSGPIPQEKGGFSCDGYVWTSPVGTFPAGASPYGALDMAGNAAEWVAEQVTRGGSMFKFTFHTNCTYSLRSLSDFRSKHNGFRVVMDSGPFEQ